MKLVAAGLAGAVALSFITEAKADFTYGWASEFFGGRAICNSDAGACVVNHFWAGPAWLGSNVSDGTMLPTWALVGQQTHAGRANTREAVMMVFRDHESTESYSMTTTISRFRYGYGSIPYEGTACPPPSTGTFIGSVSQTFDTGGIPANLKDNNRMLPVMDFSAETQTTNVNTGYRSVIAINATLGSTTGTASKAGCYQIAWGD